MQSVCIRKYQHATKLTSQIHVYLHIIALYAVLTVLLCCACEAGTLSFHLMNIFIVHPLLLSPPTPSPHPTGVRCATVLWRAVSTSPVTVPLETVCARSLLKGIAVTPALLASASWRPSIHRDVQQVHSIEQTTVMVDQCVTSGLAQ